MSVCHRKLKMPDVRGEILSFSKKTEEVLLLLLQENQELRQIIKDEILQREKNEQEMRDSFGRELQNLREKQDIEEKVRQNGQNQLQNQIDKLTKDFTETKENLKCDIDKERAERCAETQKMDEFFR